MTDYSKTAAHLFARGYEPIPIAPGKKYPTMKGWPTMKLPVAPWPRNHGVGLRTGTSVIGIDIDVYDQDVVTDLVEFLFPADKFLRRVGQPPKLLIPVCCPEIKTKQISEKYIDEHGVINQIEILSVGQQFVAAGIHPNTGEEYIWSGDLTNHDLPIVDAHFVREVINYFQGVAISRGWLSESKGKRTEAIAKNRQRAIIGDKPGSVYNRSVPIETVLEHYGWTPAFGPYWTRPGKRAGISGALYGDIFWCFTTSTPLRGGSRKEDRCFYDAFELLTQYEFAGDKSECAKALCRAMREAA